MREREAVIITGRKRNLQSQQGQEQKEGSEEESWTRGQQCGASSERLQKHSTTKPSRPTVSHWLPQEHNDALISQTRVEMLGLGARNEGT